MFTLLLSTNMNAYSYFLVAILLCFISVSSAREDNNEISRGLVSKTLLEKITSSFMTRSGDGSSQVLSLNLSNLLILVLLKALIFAAGSIGANSWKSGYGGYGRNTEDTNEDFINDTELLLYLSYLSGSPGKYQCLQNVACHRPDQALQYAKAGGLLVNVARIIPNVVNMAPEHEQTLIDLKSAAEFGKTEGNCDKKYICNHNEK